MIFFPLFIDAKELYVFIDPLLHLSTSSLMRIKKLPEETFTSLHSIESGTSNKEGHEEFVLRTIERFRASEIGGEDTEEVVDR